LKRHRFSVVLRPDEEGGFRAVVPALPGCVSGGASVEEAIARAKEAIEACLEGLVKDGQPVPDEEKFLIAIIAKVTVEVDSP
jgi:antitoxin HicB